MAEYRPRVVDTQLEELMGVLGAVLIDGPKAVGKTRTAEQRAATVLRMDVDRSARAVLDIDPEQLFASPTPILFDEWQEAPALWDLVRHAVDDRGGAKGLYLLAGSSRPRDDRRKHSGAGRIGRLRMRPMSLFESGHSTGAVSLAALLDGHDPVGAGTSSLTVTDVLERIVVGGWPEAMALGERSARAWLGSYLANIVEVDVPALGPRKNPGNLRRLLAALGRAAGTPVNRRQLEAEVGDGSPVASETLTNYLDALDRLMLTEPLPAWKPHMRSRAQLRTTPVHHFTDPSLGLAALGAGTKELLGDLNAAGLQFESLAVRDLRTYAGPIDGSLSSWRDTKSGREVDAILELPDGRWAALEFKLGESAADTAAESLLHFAGSVDTEKHGPPAALIVVTAGRFALRRPDGVLVIPISVLGP